MAENNKVLHLNRRPPQPEPEAPSEAAPGDQAPRPDQPPAETAPPAPADQAAPPAGEDAPAPEPPSPASLVAALPKPAPPEANGLSQYQVLLFHHQKGHHSHLLNTLRFCGLTNVSVTDNLEQAIQQIVSKRFHLILASHFGEARATTLLLEDLKGHDATADIPLIAVTNTNDVKEVLRIIAKGVDEVLIEPLSQELVEQKIQALLNRSKVAEERREQLKTAQAMLAGGRLPDAENLFLALLADPDLALEALLGLASVQVSRQKWGEAKSLLKRAAEGAKSSPDKISLHRNLSETFYAYGQFYEARKHLLPAAKSYRTAFSLNPFNLKNLVALLALLQKEDQLDEIVKVLREVANNYLPFSQPLDEVADCIGQMCDRFIALGLNEHASKLYRELVAIKHQNPEVHMKVADYFVQEGRVAQVVRGLVEVSGRLKDPDLLYRLGTLLLESDPQTLWSALDQAGEGFLSAGVADRPLLMAKQAFHQAMLLEPDDPRHRLGLACVELKLGNTEAASEALQRVKEADLTNVRLYLEVIRALFKERAYDLAGEWLRDANANFPKEPEVARLQAEFFLLRGDTNRAISALKKGLAQAPDDREMLLTLAKTYLQAREFSDAAFYFERLSKLSPDDPRVREGLAAALSGRQN